MDKTNILYDHYKDTFLIQKFCYTLLLMIINFKYLG